MNRNPDGVKPDTPATPRALDDDEEDEWRHAPRPARDESPAESLGRAVSEVVTGPSEDATGEPQPDLTGTRRNPSR